MYNFIKRAFDIISSGLGLVILSPILAILGFLVMATSKGPALFKQKRVGKNKTYFYMLKFRSMRIDSPKDVPTHLLSDPYAFITPVGKFLRKTSLDELPQLWNIFKGDMSIVGPRPALWNQDDLIAERDKYNANSIRPGLTGLAQISGRDELPIDVKAAYDGEYIKKMGVFYDFKIMSLTAFNVLSSRGVAEGGAKPTKRE